jgi:hypothetical protein
MFKAAIRAPNKVNVASLKGRTSARDPAVPASSKRGQGPYSSVAREALPGWINSVQVSGQEQLPQPAGLVV